ncbi:hypothetical protein K4L44_02890 [Halosquirtibacter laminarini]|uniref:Uncharacterized protein n=1 Tax=Halosquirtibacter laminarini TaxID=3374600 RepID=A0AC61NPE3_9BACT|nr:hypothetical protein K4L44_02890 [Prolixibacteraceae bacterium]
MIIKTETFIIIFSLLGILFFSPSLLYGQTPHSEVKPIELLPGILSPKTFFNNDSTTITTYHGLVDRGETPFNLVDGFSVWQSVTKKWIPSTTKFIEIHGSAAYDISKDEFLGRVHMLYTSDRKNYWSLNIQNLSEDFKGGVGENSILDLSAILFAQRNYKKYYRSQAAIFHWCWNPPYSRWNFASSISYSHFMPLENITDFTFFPRDNRDFDSNEPTNIQLKASQTEEQRSIDYRGEMRYFLDDYHYRNISLTYDYGLNTNSRDTYHKFSIHYDDGIGTSQSKLLWNVDLGTFFGTTPYHFSQYHHTYSTHSDVTAYSMSREWFVSNDYGISTMKPWIESMIAYQRKKMILTQIPFFEHTTAYEAFYIKSYFSKEMPTQWAAGYTIHKLFQSLSFGINYHYNTDIHGVWGFYLGLPFMNNVSKKRYTTVWN